jgi:general secretion pathway protein J
MRRRAFTLVEVMLAVTLLAVIGAVVAGTLTNTLKARDLLASDDAVQRSVRVATERLTHELQLAYLTPHTSAVATYRTVFVAQHNEPVDVIWFDALSHRPLYHNAHECDQTEITLWAEQDPENPDLAVLMQREAPRIDQEPDQDGVILPIAHGVRRFDLRFLDGQTAEWKDVWDSTGAETPNRLPRAVQIVLVISAPDIEKPDELVDHTYLTTVMLDYAKPMTKDLLGGGTGSTSTLSDAMGGMSSSSGGSQKSSSSGTKGNTGTGNQGKKQGGNSQKSGRSGRSQGQRSGRSSDRE